MPKQIRTAVVGTGFIGPVHVEALRRLGIEVVGILGSSYERGTETADRLRLPKAYESLDALLSEPNLDVVHVTTPNNLHAPMVKSVLAAGKSVVCEKPLAMTADEGEELLEIATRTGAVNAVNFNIRFYPQCHHARELVVRGELGDLYLIHGRYLQDWLLRQTDWNWRLEPELGGEMRAVADIGSHWLDLVTFITGQRIVEVFADFATLLPIRKKPTRPVETFAGQELQPGEYEEQEIRTEDYATVLLHFDDGARGVVTVSQVSAGRKNHLAFEIDGSNASLSWVSERPEELWIGRRERPSELLLRDPGLFGESARATTDYPGGHAEGFPDTFKQLYRAFYADVERGKPSDSPAYPTFKDGVTALRLGEAILQSARTREWAPVS